MSQDSFTPQEGIGKHISCKNLSGVYSGLVLNGSSSLTWILWKLPPTPRPVRESSIYYCGNELPSCDEHVVDRHQTTSYMSGSYLCNVHWDCHRGKACKLKKIAFILQFEWRLGMHQLPSPFRMKTPKYLFPRGNKPLFYHQIGNKNFFILITNQ